MGELPGRSPIYNRLALMPNNVNDCIPRAVNAALQNANAAAASCVSQNITVLIEQLRSALSPNPPLALGVAACLDVACDNIKTSITNNLASLCISFSHEYTKMANEYEMCIAEMKKQHKIRLALIESENSILKLRNAEQERTLQMLKSMEELNYSLRSKNGEFTESDEIEHASKL